MAYALPLLLLFCIELFYCICNKFVGLMCREIVQSSWSELVIQNRMLLKRITLCLSLMLCDVDVVNFQKMTMNMSEW